MNHASYSMSDKEATGIITLNCSETEIAEAVREHIRQQLEDKPTHEMVSPTTAFNNAKRVDTDTPMFSEKDVNAYVAEHEELFSMQVDNFYVPYYDVRETPVTKNETMLRERLAGLYEKHKTYSEAHSIKNHKAAFIGCTGCKSRIAKEFFESDNCPLCGENLQSETTQRTLNGYETHIADVTKQIEKSVRNRCAKSPVLFVVFYNIPICEKQNLTSCFENEHETDECEPDNTEE